MLAVVRPGGTSNQRRGYSVWRFGWLVISGLLLGGAGHARGQEEELAPAEEVTLETADHVTIAATYFPGLKNENTVPVILVHAHKGSRQDYASLAEALQAAGHAVIVPDLRGHGDSLSVAGTTRKLDADQMPAAHYLRMAGPGGDLDRAKSYLIQRHNKRELNIDKLVVVGAEMGAVIAVNWTLQDWSWPVLATGRQGQDVKALVLVSPSWSFKSLKFEAALSHRAIRNELAFYICVGQEDAKSLTDSKRIHKALARNRGEPADPREQTLILRTEATSLKGAKLLNEPTLNVNALINEFIQVRVAEQAGIWKERKNPLD